MTVAQTAVSRASVRHAALSLALAIATLGGAFAGLPGCHYGTYTERVVSGQLVRGRTVDEGAYSEYLSGVMLEAQGEWGAAYEAYRRAQSQDPGSAEIWTRLGVVSCRRGHAELAAEAFEDALDLDRGYAPAFLGLAECELRRGRPDAALEAGIRAVGFDPRSVPATVLVARVLEERGKTAEAISWLRGLVSYVPQDPRAWEALREFAIRASDVADEARADRALARMHAGEARTPAATELDAALFANDLARARAVATDLRLPPAYVAVRAGALGKYELARQQAMLVWRADPNSTDAWIVLCVTDETSPGEPASRPSAPRRVASPLAARLFASLLAKRLGPQTAAAWVAAMGPLPPARDPVEVDLERAWTESR